MSDDENPFANLPGFKETIARLARVPSESEAAKPAIEFVCRVTDEKNEIAYKLVSPRSLSPAEVRRALARAFTRTDVWPNEAGEVEIPV